MTDSTHALHMRGNHSKCDYLLCEERQAEESVNRECMYAKAVLAAIRKRGGIPDQILGDEHSRYIKLSRTPQPDYLPQRPGPQELIKANMDVREAMAGIPVIWSCAEYDDDDDDFDIDEFLEGLA